MRFAPQRYSWRSWAAFVAACLTAAAYLHLRSENIPDPDGLYHIQHAALYRANGLGATEFPWIPWSVISTLRSDIWYGFHLLLVPFTFIQDPGLRVKVPGIVLSAAMMVGFGLAAVRLRIAKPFLWPFVLLLCAPNILYHLTMTRPHVLSMGLCAVLFACLVEGGAVPVFLTSLAICFVHLSFFWIIPLIVVVVLFMRALPGGPPAWGKALAALLGIVAGWVARPNPAGSAALMKIQLFELMLEKQSGVPLTFAKELFPITGRVIAENFIPFLLLWAGAIGISVWGLARGVTGGTVSDASGGEAPDVSEALARDAAGGPARDSAGRPAHGAAGRPAHGAAGGPAREGAGRLTRDAGADQTRVAGNPLPRTTAAPMDTRYRTFLWSSGILSAGFFGMTLFVARRSFDPWAVFSVLFVAGVYTFFVDTRGPHAAGRAGTKGGRVTGTASAAADTDVDNNTDTDNKALTVMGSDLPGIPTPRAAQHGLSGSRAHAAVTIAGVAVIVVMATWSTWRSAVSLKSAAAPRECEEVGHWLEAHSRPGEIVYNVHWDTFARLFYWDRTNRFVSGMDPIFQFAYDRGLYWRSHYLQTGKATRFVCSNPACTPDSIEETYIALTRDFQASWLFIEKPRSPELYAYVKTDPRFVPSFENAKQAVFRLEK